MKSMWRVFCGFVVLALVATVAMGCGSEDPETVAQAMCNSMESCGEEPADNCVASATEVLEEMRDNNPDCYDATADFWLCAESADCQEGACSNEGDAMVDAC